jgi:hypothetical protein
MEKKDKEKIISKIRLKELEFVDRDMTALFFKMIAGFLAILAFLYTSGIVKNLLFLGIIGIGEIAYLCWWQFQSYKYISDYYTHFSNAVIEGKIIQYKPLEMTFLENIFYKKRYN